MADRARARLILTTALVGLVALGMFMVVSAPASPQGCVRSPDYGTQCETLSGSHLTVTQVEARFTTFPDFFTQDVWAFETTVYRCDPRGRSKRECPPEQRTFGTINPKNPRNTADTVCASNSSSAGGNICSRGLGFPVPHTFAGARWLCTEIAVRVNGKWVDNGAGLPSGDRACKHVH